MTVGLKALLLATALLPPVDPQPIVMQPSGKWTVNNDPASCIITRQFGSATEGVTLAIVPPVLTEDGQVILIAPEKAQSDIERGKGSKTIDGVQSETWYTTKVSKITQTRSTRILIDATDVFRLKTSSVITLPLTKARYLTLPTKGFSSALVATKPCRDHILAEWGVDLAAMARIVKPAEPLNAANWIKPADYPVEALRGDIEGDTTIVWMVGEDGRVRNCRSVLVSAATPFDAVACGLITKRGRYVPATDAAGKAVPSWSTRRIQWRLP